MVSVHGQGDGASDGASDACAGRPASLGVVHVDSVWTCGQSRTRGVGNLSADLGECAERGPCDTPGDAPEGRLRTTCNGCRCKTKPVTVAES